ncbi:hypothetical protein BKA70DRAFT_1418624 [Coprinopsis sp. MPI-PUGE-AT-0042]|nr:hypothetical protein BKA70DRAFT_1418624 [Coprinopsis sp. MPI-PUGE-AT-0042]
MSAESGFPPGMDMSSPEAQAAAAEAMKQLQQLWSVISDIRMTKYIYVAAAIIMFWDMCLTFDLEVQRVWKTKSSLGKYLFIFNRYIPPILFIFDLIYVPQTNYIPVLPSHCMSLPRLDSNSANDRAIHSCRNSFLPSSVLGILAIGTVEFVLVLRTYALYHKQWLLYTMIFLCIGSCATMAAAVGYLFGHYITFLPPGSLPGLPGCTSDCSHPMCRTLLTVFWVPFFVLETLIVVLTVWKSWTSYTSIGAKKSPFVSIVYRDGLMYYAVIMSVSIANLVVWTTAPQTLSYLATSMMRSLQVTISSRILLNIRGMLDRGYGTTSYFNSTVTQLSTMGYADPKNKSTRTDPSSFTQGRSSDADYPLETLKNPSSTWEEGERW